MNEVNTLKEREVLKFHYGWYDKKCMTMNEISELLGLKGRDALNIESRAMRKIRGSKWGRIKIKEKYGQMKTSSLDSINKTLETLDFTYKYLSNLG